MPMPYSLGETHKAACFALDERAKGIFSEEE